MPTGVIAKAGELNAFLLPLSSQSKPTPRLPTPCMGTIGEGTGQAAVEEQQVRETGCIQIHWAGKEEAQANGALVGLECEVTIYL